MTEIQKCKIRRDCSEGGFGYPDCPCPKYPDGSCVQVDLCAVTKEMISAHTNQATPLHDGDISGRYICLARRPVKHGGLGSSDCHCPRFSDGSCVPPKLMPEFTRRRDLFYQSKVIRDFDERETYV